MLSKRLKQKEHTELALIKIFAKNKHQKRGPNKSSGF